MISGLSLIENFISAEQEQHLLSWVGQQVWDDSLKRRVQHYGYRYDYKARTVNPADYLGPLPAPFTGLAQQLSEYGFCEKPDQLIINEYEPGQGIAAHIDCVPCFGPLIAGITLGGGAEMQFSNISNPQRKQALYLSPRSLLLLQGEARFDWKHGIAARKSDIINGVKTLRSYRVSLTFRKTKT